MKNRFSTLCKKRAKYEALAKENSTTYMNSNNKRVLLRSGFSTDGTSETVGSSTKKMRYNENALWITVIGSLFLALYGWSSFFLQNAIQEKPHL